MRDKGIDPASVDIVAMTHLHGDHVGWNLDDADGKPNFPNARYLVPQGDWDFFTAALDSNPQMQQVIPLKELGRMDLISGETRLTADDQSNAHAGPHARAHELSDRLGRRKGGHHGRCRASPGAGQRDNLVPSVRLRTHSRAVIRGKRLMEMLEAEGTTAAFCHFPNHSGRSCGSMESESSKHSRRA